MHTVAAVLTDLPTPPTGANARPCYRMMKVDARPVSCMDKVGEAGSNARIAPDLSTVKAHHCRASQLLPPHSTQNNHHKALQPLKPSPVQPCTPRATRHPQTQTSQEQVDFHFTQHHQMYPLQEAQALYRYIHAKLKTIRVDKAPREQRRLEPFTTPCCQ